MTALAIPANPVEVSNGIADRVIRQVDLCNDTEVAAVIDQEVLKLTKRQLAGFAAAWVHISVDAEVRQRTRDAEEAAQRAYEQSLEGRAERAAEELKRQQREDEFQAWKVQQDRESEERHRQINLEFNAKMKIITDQFKEHCFMEWTQELLDSPFALGDGRTVTWGDATVDDHRQRVAMLVKHATGTVQSAARHEKAIDELQAAGANTLREMTA